MDVENTGLGWYVDNTGRVRYEPDLGVKRRLCLENIVSVTGHKDKRGWHTSAEAQVAIHKLNDMQDFIGYPEVPECPKDLKREYTR